MFPASRIPILSVLAIAAAVGGCTQDMADQPRYEPLEASSFFPNHMASRPLVDGTVARGHLRVDTAFFEGKVDGQDVSEFPLARVAEKLHFTGDSSHQMQQVLRAGSSGSISFAHRATGETGEAREWSSNVAFPRRRRTIRRDCVRRRWAIFTTSCRWDSAGCRATPRKFHPRIAGPSWRTFEPCS